jgi:hypothetical protein
VVTGEQLTVKESKIAAGAEADKTNELLQSLAKAINIKVRRREIHGPVACFTFDCLVSMFAFSPITTR